MPVPNDEVWETLRKSLHTMIDTTLNQAIHTAQQRTDQEETNLNIIPGKKEDPFTYTFPDKEQVHFTEARWFTCAGPYGTVKMLDARGEIDIWRERRRVHYIFGRKGGPENPLTTGSWAQFVETDDGEFACAIKDPSDPQKMLKEGMPLPTRYAQARVARRDKLFAPVKNGPTLWYSVPESDSDAMLTHAYYAAHLHDRF